VQNLEGKPLMASSVSHGASLIAECMDVLHSRIPAGEPVDLDKPAHIEIREERFRGQNVKRAVVFLLTNGCEWALKSAHGCTMCGHLAKQIRTDQPIAAEHFARQFSAAVSEVDFTDIPVLNIFNNGSFFNDNEIPAEARRSMLRVVSSNKSIKRLLVECRPEFLSESIIRETMALIPDVELEIAIGLETADDTRRTIAVNKGLTTRQFERAAALITSNGAHLRTYVLLKPPFFSEQEAIADAVQAIEASFAAGAETVSLEAVTVQKYTLIEYLSKNGLYRVPWLWSILEVLKETAHLGRVVVGLFQFYPSPDLVPNNCELCNHEVMDAIISYNRTLRTEVLDGLDCECREAWERTVREEEGFSRNLESFFVRARNDGLLRDATS